MPDSPGADMLREVFRTGMAICILLVATAHVPAQPFVLVGAGAGYMDQKTEANQPWSATSAGVMLQSYVDLTPSFGMYTAAVLGFVAASRDNGTALDVGQYQTLSLDFLLGIGLRVPLDPITGVIGGGIYLGSTTMNASGDTLSSFAAGGVGVGAGLSVLYPLSESWGIGATVNAAYFFGIPGSSTPTMAPSGFTFFGGLGVAYTFPAEPLLGPGISRF